MKRGSARPLTKDQIKIINAKASARFKEQDLKSKKNLKRKRKKWLRREWFGII